MFSWAGIRKRGLVSISLRKRGLSLGIRIPLPLFHKRESLKLRRATEINYFGWGFVDGGIYSRSVTAFEGGRAWKNCVIPSMHINKIASSYRRSSSTFPHSHIPSFHSCFRFISSNSYKLSPRFILLSALVHQQQSLTVVKIQHPHFSLSAIAVLMIFYSY